MKLELLLLVALFISGPANAADPAAVQEMLNAFKQNFRSFMDLTPQKHFTGQPVKLFPSEAGREFVTVKNASRKINGKAAFRGADDAAALVDNANSMLTKLEDMEKLRKAKLPDSPWSDYYWALVMGETAYRYADSRFPKDEKSYLKNTKFLLAELERFEGSSIDKLSPAEKYDILVGDRDWTLTHSAIEAGRPYQEAYKKVESWMGICNGWSPASFMLKRPRNLVKVKSADGKYDIGFFPTDIKALASSLWAKAPAGEAVRFIGGRCDVKNPKHDSSGRVADAECFDTNPGTWHLAVVNQIGVSKRSFVMDATFDAEVWNQPVYSYKYSYFNPNTLKNVSSLSAAKVSIADFNKDKFKKYRSPKTKFVVGIAMDLSYVAETVPDHAKKDEPGMDATTEVTYLYDLELDALGNIIGGEWLHNMHPDFLWTPAPNARAATAADARIKKSDWSSREKSIPASWSPLAKRAAREGMPLAAIVENLITFSNRVR